MSLLHATIPVDERILDSMSPARRQRAMALSIVPGLGHFYMGEYVPGVMFLAVGALNLLSLIAVVNTNEVVQAGLRVLNLCNVSHLNHGIQIGCPCAFVKLFCLALNIAFVLFVAKQAYLPRVPLLRSRITEMPQLAPYSCASYVIHFSILLGLLVSVLINQPAAHKQTTVSHVEFVLEQKETPAAVHTFVPAPTQKPAEAHKPLVQESIKTPKLTTHKIELPKADVKMPSSVPIPTSNLPAISKASEIKSAPVNVATETTDISAKPAEPAAATSGTAALASGNVTQKSSGSNSASSDSSDGEVDMSAYISNVWTIIKKNWHPPRDFNSNSCTIKFRIKPDGSVDSIRIVKSSGLDTADQAAETAITTAAPFPELPKGVHEDVDIKFSFDYNLFKK